MLSFEKKGGLMRKMYCNLKIFSLIFFVLLIFAFASCGIGTTKIGDITGHPRDYAGKEVTVSGEVTETFSLFVVRYFVLRDATGEITVVTDRPLPAKGEKIKAKGVVKEAFSLGTQSTLVLVEGTEKGAR
jgi:aspartyl/asparaginyl-tRNA synthetase